MRGPHYTLSWAGRGTDRRNKSALRVSSFPLPSSTDHFLSLEKGNDFDDYDIAPPLPPWARPPPTNLIGRVHTCDEVPEFLRDYVMTFMDLEFANDLLLNVRSHKLSTCSSFHLHVESWYAFSAYWHLRMFFNIALVALFSSVYCLDVSLQILACWECFITFCAPFSCLCAALMWYFKDWLHTNDLSHRAHLNDLIFKCIASMSFQVVLETIRMSAVGANVFLFFSTMHCSNVGVQRPTLSKRFVTQVTLVLALCIAITCFTNDSLHLKFLSHAMHWNGTWPSSTWTLLLWFLRFPLLAVKNSHLSHENFFMPRCMALMCFCKSPVVQAE